LGDNCFENPDNHGLAPFEWEDIREKAAEPPFWQAEHGQGSSSVAHWQEGNPVLGVNLR